MLQESDWATMADFATLFHYFWYRDFPIDPSAIGARRSDWTIHIGIVVRNVANLLGLIPRFESGKRKDAILRSDAGDEVAIEWEWNGVFGKANELKKLKEHKTWRKRDKQELKYAVLITYTHTENIQKVYDQVKAKWGEGDGAKWPLLLILIDVNDVSKKQLTSGKEFNRIQMVSFNSGKNVECTLIRSGWACPWKVEGSRLSLSWSSSKDSQ